MRIAAIEVSHWHSLHDAAYLRILAGIPDVELVGLHDPDAGIAAARAEALGVGAPVFTDHQEMLARTKPDFVVALGQHRRMARTAHDLLDHGVPLLHGRKPEFRRPTAEEIHREQLQSIERSWRSRLPDLSRLTRLEAKDRKPYIRALLYPARLIYTWDNLVVGSNDCAVEYLHAIGPQGVDLRLIDAALAGVCTTEFAKDMDDAVRACASAARAGETTLNFLTPLETDISQPGGVTLRTAARSGERPVRVCLEYDATKLAPTVERIELTDGRLAKSWGTHLNRLLLRAKSPALRDAWTLRLAQE